ncbi:hypothetical protein B0I37DRAFT_303441 [Chaetomium sp. MPI-CAGE-AT-0009]|nr:hypothetical protein B0I37DRAFT_303441 [Chaetomium sp. MPI-CAGE-AT-0009]
MDWLQVSLLSHDDRPTNNGSIDTPVDAACSAASDAISGTLFVVSKFVREVRESRSDFDKISTELHSLNGVLDLLGYDAAFLSVSLAGHTRTVLESCLAIINELEGCVSDLLNRPDVPTAEKRSRWLASRDHVDALRRTLGEYKLVLGLAADLVGITKSQANGGAEDNELATVTAQLVELSSRFRKMGSQQSVALARLGQYIDALRAEAEPESRCTPAQRNDPSRRAHRTSSMGGAPDSAIDVSYDDMERPTFRLGKQAAPSALTSYLIDSGEEGKGNFVGELSEMPRQPPSLSSRPSSRMSSGSASRSTRGSSTAEVHMSPGSTPMSSWPRTPRLSASSSDAPQRPPREPYFTPGTDLLDQTWGRPSSTGTRTPSIRSSAFSQVLDSVSENPRAEVPSPAPPATPNSDTAQPRRSGFNLTTTFRGLGLLRPSLKPVDEGPGQADAVFGVPLAKSIQVAKGVASTRHGTGDSSARATREYPLVVLRCVYHIRDCGLEEPHIFGLAGDHARLAQLKEVFNSAHTNYGKDVDWTRFTIHDAADLIRVFLSELPKPVISESVAKRWFALSRQATSGGARLDKALDFWEEAMMGIHGPGRALFKLLINLWGDIADAADANMMTPERLAGRLVQPLMHSAAGRRQTDFMLGLAFLIRKRSEYNIVARGAGRETHD